MPISPISKKRDNRTKLAQTPRQKQLKRRQPSPQDRGILDRDFLGEFYRQYGTPTSLEELLELDESPPMAPMPALSGPTGAVPMPALSGPSSAVPMPSTPRRFASKVAPPLAGSVDLAEPPAPVINIPPMQQGVGQFAAVDSTRVPAPAMSDTQRSAAEVATQPLGPSGISRGEQAPIAPPFQLERFPAPMAPAEYSQFGPPTLVTADPRYFPDRRPLVGGMGDYDAYQRRGLLGLLERQDESRSVLPHRGGKGLEQAVPAATQQQQEASSQYVPVRDEQQFVDAEFPDADKDSARLLGVYSGEYKPARNADQRAARGGLSGGGSGGRNRVLKSQSRVNPMSPAVGSVSAEDQAMTYRSPYTGRWGTAPVAPTQGDYSDAVANAVARGMEFIPDDPSAGGQVANADGFDTLSPEKIARQQTTKKGKRGTLRGTATVDPLMRDAAIDIARANPGIDKAGLADAMGDLFPDAVDRNFGNIRSIKKAANSRNRRDAEMAKRKSAVTENAQTEAEERRLRLAGMDPALASIMAGDDQLAKERVMYGANNAARIAQSRAANQGLDALRQAEAQQAQAIARYYDRSNPAVAEGLDIPGAETPAIAPYPGTNVPNVSGDFYADLSAGGVVHPVTGQPLPAQQRRAILDGLVDQGRLTQSQADELYNKSKNRTWGEWWSGIFEGESKQDPMIPFMVQPIIM